MNATVYAIPIKAPQRSGPPATAASEQLPSLEDFPIPAEFPIGGKGWSDFMIEMADHIGPRATLLLLDAIGGRRIYIPGDPARTCFPAIVGDTHAATICRVYRSEVVAFPTAKAALSIARRGAVLALVRAGQLSTSDAASILDMRRDYISRLISRTDEGVGLDVGPLPVRRSVRLLSAAAEIAATCMTAAGVATATIERARSKIMGLVA